MIYDPLAKQRRLGGLTVRASCKGILMKNRVLSPLICLVVFVAAQTAYSQGFPYHVYDPRTMAELAVLGSASEGGQTVGLTNIGISANPFYSAVRLEYAGQVRNLSDRKLGYYKMWATSLNIGSANSNQNVLDIIKKEYLFKECEKEYWIAVATPAATDFPKGMKKGDRLTLYLMLAGGMKYDKEPWTGMYLANSFKIYQ